MYKVDEIKEKLYGLIGWRQNYNTHDFTIAEDLTVSESGKYFQDEHPLLTLGNIKSVAPDHGDEAFSEWLTLKTKAGIVKAIDTLYGRDVTKKDITNHIISQKVLFADTISKQVAVDLLREFAYNPNFRISRSTQNVSRIELLYELDGDSTSEKKSGLVHKLDLAYKAIGKKCLPKRISGISVGSMT